MGDLSLWQEQRYPLRERFRGKVILWSQSGHLVCLFLEGRHPPKRSTACCTPDPEGLFQGTAIWPWFRHPRPVSAGFQDTPSETWRVWTWTVSRPQRPIRATCDLSVNHAAAKTRPVDSGHSRNSSGAATGGWLLNGCEKSFLVELSTLYKSWDFGVKDWAPGVSSCTI